MPRPQPSSTFVVPSTPSAAAPTPARDAKPFVLVPAAFVAGDSELEPHWLPAIDAATD